MLFHLIDYLGHVRFDFQKVSSVQSMLNFSHDFVYNSMDISGLLMVYDVGNPFLEVFPFG